MDILTQRVPTGVVIFRGKPVHLAHMWVVEQALNLCDTVVIVIGSSWRSRNPKNPFIFEEVRDMLMRSMTPEQRSRVRIVGVRDVYNDARWCAMVRTKVNAIAQPGSDVALVGYLKDSSSYYLQRFPEWEFIDAGSNLSVNATDLRHILFGGRTRRHALNALMPFVPLGVIDFLSEWTKGEHYSQRCAEHRAVVAYKKKYTAQTYLTGDAIVEVEDHVLLAKRGQVIGLDTWAWPGGFRNPAEPAIMNAIRELLEETGLHVTAIELQAALVDQHHFNAPGRSCRGQINTDAFYFKLTDRSKDELLVVGQDDVKFAEWVPKAELPARMHNMFDDHDVIGEHFLGEMVPEVEVKLDITP